MATTREWRRDNIRRIPRVRSYTIFIEDFMSVPAMPIDTQQVVDKLTGAGVPDQQAKAHASVLSDALRSYDAQLATRVCSKQDLAAALDPIFVTLTRLEASIKALEAAIKAVDAKIDATAARLDAKIDVTTARLDAKIDATAARLDEKIDASSSKMKGELIGWMLSIWAFQSALITALVLKVAS
jgi:hypothetical protein